MAGALSGITCLGLGQPAKVAVGLDGKAVGNTTCGGNRDEKRVATAASAQPKGNCKLLAKATVGVKCSWVGHGDENPSPS